MSDPLTRASGKGGIKQSLFYFLAAVAVGITEPRWEGKLKGKQRSPQFLFSPLLCSLFIHAPYNKAGAENTAGREFGLTVAVGRAIKIGSEG